MEPSTSVAASLYPPSLGLSFALESGNKALSVHAEWGWYRLAIRSLENRRAR
jgi:hypothetical protein